MRNFHLDKEECKFICKSENSMTKDVTRGPNISLKNDVAASPWKHEIGDGQSVPGGVRKEVVASTAVVHKHHQQQ